MESGWDPGVKKYFAKILNSVALGSMWMLAVVYAGFYHELAYSKDKPVIYIILYYLIAFVTLLLLIRYLYRTWKNE